MMPTWMYSKGADGIYVNLFVGSTVNVGDVAGTDVEMVQTTELSVGRARSSITVNPAAAKSFAVRIRVPNRDVSSALRVARRRRTASCRSRSTARS